ncbi:MAG TPA: flippase [Thermoplasmata archaeon]|nr:flippase [Thermoplasmata archaeon]
MQAEASGGAAQPLPSPPPSGGGAPGGATSPGAARRGYERTIGSLSRGTAVMMAATIVFVLLQFLTRVLVTRNVSVDEWGEFNLGLAFANFLALIAAFGIPPATARSIAFEETLAARLGLVKKALTVSLPVAVASAVLVYVFADALAAPFHGPELPDVFRLFAVSISLTMLSNVVVGIFQGLERAEPNALFLQILNPSLFFAFTALAIGFHLGFTGVLWAYVLSWVGAFAALGAYSYRRLPALLRSDSGHAFTGDESARVGFVELSVTLFGVAALTYLTSYADTLLLGVFRPEAIVGENSSAMNLARLLLVGTGTVTFIFLPVSSRLRRERDFAGIRRTYVTVTRWMALLTLPFTFLFAFDPVFSLAFTFGPLQTGGATALQILVVVNTVSILLGPSTATLGGLGRTSEVLRFTLLSAFTNFALCLVLIPPYGMIGAAVAWSVARFMFPALALIRVYQLHGVTPFARHFVVPLAVSAVVLCPIFYFILPPPTLRWIVLFLALPFVVLVGAILATRSVDQGDVFFARLAERRFGSVLRPIRRLLESRQTPETAAEPGWPAGG